MEVVVGRTGGVGGGRGMRMPCTGTTGRKQSALNLKRTPGEGAGCLENVQLFPFADFAWLSSQLIFTQQEYTFLLPT